MRFRELFESESDSTQSDVKAQVLSVIDFLRNRAHDQKVLPSSSTIGLLTMINNAGGNAGVMNFDTLRALVDSDPALKDLVKKMDRNTVTLAPFGDEPNAPQEEPVDNTGGEKAKDPTKIVDKMAKRASDKRDF